MDEFPTFYSAINEKVKRACIVHDVDERIRMRNNTTGLDFLPVDICIFIDCSIDQIRRPLSGPNGNYKGASRKEGYDEVQRAFYTGYKKYHGIKVETVLLLYGLSTLFGPVSARSHNINGELQMSQLNKFLVAIQRNRPQEYQALGNGAYGCNLRCIWSRRYHYLIVI